MSSPQIRHHVTVIGTGSIGERHARCFLRTDRADVSICEIDQAIRHRMQASYRLTSVYEEFSQLLDAEPGIAVICTPAQLHVSMAKRLVDRGFSVLMEKPVSVSMEGVADLQSAVQMSSAKCAVAYVLRGSPLMQHAKRQIDASEVGELLEVIVAGGQHFPTYRPAYRETYYKERSTGGGAIQDALTHWVNAVEWFAGPMSRVAADCDRLVLDGVRTEDSVNAIARHGAVMANYSINQHQAPNETVFRFVCRQGVVEVLSHQQLCRIQREPEQPWQTELTTQLERDDLFVDQANRFMDYVEGHGPPACSLDEGVDTLRSNLGILEAADSRQWITIDRSQGDAADG